MKNLEVANLFNRVADALALLDDNTFRILAHRKVAQALEDVPHPVELITGEGALERIPGIGKASADRIREYLRTGRVAEFDDLLSQVPAGVLEMIRIPTLGPKTAALLWREGGVTSIQDLKAKIDSGVLVSIKGIGEKKLKKIRENLDHIAKAEGRIRLGDALPVAEEFTAYLRTLPGVKDAQYCGSVRRGKELIADIDVAVSASNEDAPKIAAAVAKSPMTAVVIQTGTSKTSIRTGNGLQVDVRVVPPESYGAALQYFTGSQAHNVKLREMAVKKGLKLNEWGLFRVDKATGKEERIAGVKEEEIYTALGLAFVPPAMREDRGEIDWAIERFAKNKNEKTIELIEEQHIRGDLHMHTTASDGTATIEEMVTEAKKRGYQYIAITDHSKSQFQAGGLTADRLLEHIEKVHAVSREAEKSGMLVLAGSEVDILADGSMDYEDDLLAKLDWVVGSPHAALTQESEPATQRLVRAISNPYVCIIGHPTGRVIPTRRGLEPDMSKVVFAAARNGVALEINSSSYRLDLRDTHAKLAIDAGVMISIDTDAHAANELHRIHLGVLTARRAWATPDKILNAKPVEEFKRWLKERKEMAQWK